MFIVPAILWLSSKSRANEELEDDVSGCSSENQVEKMPQNLGQDDCLDCYVHQTIDTLTSNVLGNLDDRKT